jgi:hypothetical protein
VLLNVRQVAGRIAVLGVDQRAVELELLDGRHVAGQRANVERDGRGPYPNGVIGVVTPGIVDRETREVGTTRRERQVDAVDADVRARHGTAVALDGGDDDGVEATGAVAQRHGRDERDDSQDDDQDCWTHTRSFLVALARPARTMRRLRDLLQGFAGRFPLAREREIAERYDADETLLAVNDRQAANLLVAHVLEHGFDALVDEAVENARRHRIARRLGPHVAALGDDAHDDVAIGHHADEPLVLDHGRCADVAVAHFASDFQDWGVGPDEAHVGRHDILNSHARTLLAMPW